MSQLSKPITATTKGILGPKKYGEHESVVEIARQHPDRAGVRGVESLSEGIGSEG